MRLGTFRHGLSEEATLPRKSLGSEPTRQRGRGNQVPAVGVSGLERTDRPLGTHR
jgi:hypothetical protein